MLRTALWVDHEIGLDALLSEVLVSIFSVARLALDVFRQVHFCCGGDVDTPVEEVVRWEGRRRRR